MQGKCLTFGINGSFDSREKKFSKNFITVNTTFCLILHYNADNSYLSINGKEIFKFKADIKSFNFPTQICLKSISKGFSATESTEVSLNENLYNFQSNVILNLNLNFKCDILNTHKYSMNKNNMK